MENRQYKIGYDFDGVITEGIIPDKEGVIITGNTADKEIELRRVLTEIGAPNIQMPIEFFPDKELLDNNPDKIDELVGGFKAQKIKEFGVLKFYEDNDKQIEIIKEQNPDVEIVKVENLSPKSSKKLDITYVFFTIDGIGLSIAQKLQEEGNKVYIGQVSDWSKLGIEQKEKEVDRDKRLSIFDGILEKYDADKLLKALLKVKDKENYSIFCDFNYLYPYAEKLKEAGFKGLLPTKDDYEFEKDRNKAKEFVENNYPIFSKQEVYEFSNIDEAIDFLNENQNTLFVLKGNHPDAPTIVPISDEPEENHDELVNELKKNKKIYEQEGFILEEKISDIREFTPESMAYNGNIVGINVDIEAKYLGAGDTGGQTGCSFCVVIWLNKDSQIYEKFLKPLEGDILRKNELTIGDASVLYSPSRDKFYFGEFSKNRWGFDSVFAELSTFNSVSEYFEQILEGKNLNPKYKYGVAVRLFNIDKEKNLLIHIKNNKNIWLFDAKKKEESIYTCGVGKDIAVVTGAGNTLEEAVENAYNNLKNIKFDGMYYRPKHDFLSFDYPTSIPNRMNLLNELYGVVDNIENNEKITQNNN